MPTKPRLAQRIFIVGVPRSGTTLVQSLLAAHSSVTSFTESHFFSRHFSLLPWLATPILTRNPTVRLHEFLAENDEQPAGAADGFGARAALPFQTRRVARQLLQVLDELALRRGKSIWLEKTPRHLRYIPLIEKVSDNQPRTSFVHVIRDGLEVVASLHRASQSWERAYDLESCVKRWNEDVCYSLARFTMPTNPPTDHCVFYEDLTCQPEKTLRPLLDGLGLDWQPDILERYAHTSDRLITGQETWKEGVSRGIRRSSTSKQALTAEQRRWIKQALRHDLYDQIRQLVCMT